MRYSTLILAVLLAVTLGVFTRTGNYEFINFDDPMYVPNNRYVKQGITGENILWAFTATTPSNWHPLTWLSHMMDVELYGLNPGGHHLTNAFIHAASTLLLFMFLVQITAAPWQSLFVAALFALHPLHVESVAWIAERKDVLSCFFWFLTLIFYARYLKRPGLKRYLITLLSFIAGLMTKPMLVTLPLVMLLLDYWPFNRFQRVDVSNPDLKPLTAYSPWLALLKEKIPFLVFSAFDAVVTMVAQSESEAMKSLVEIPMALRIENSVVACAKYIGKMIWPHDLAILYPFPSSLPLWQVIGSCLLLLLISLLTIRFRRCYPYLLMGWLWFVVTLLPVVGLIQVGGQSMADRYTYITLIGLFIMCSWLVPDLMQGWRHRRSILAVLAGVVVSTLAAVTWQQLGYWKDSVTLYQHTLQVTTGNYRILNNYAHALADQGNLDGAIAEFQKALRIWPKAASDYALAKVNLARALAKRGRSDEAIVQYQEALKLDPTLADVHLNLGILLVKRGEYNEALQQYYMVLRLEPHSTKGPINMGAAFAQVGRLGEAIECFDQALRIDPKSVEAHFNLGVALARQNRIEEAVNHFSKALNLRPDLDAARRWIEALKHRK